MTAWPPNPSLPTASAGILLQHSITREDQTMLAFSPHDSPLASQKASVLIVAFTMIALIGACWSSLELAVSRDICIMLNWDKA